MDETGAYYTEWSKPERETHLIRRVDSLEKTLRLEGIVGRRRRGRQRMRWLDGWMASAAWWTWVWVKSKSKGLVIRNLPANAGDLGSIPGLGRSPGERNGNHSSNLARKIPWREDPSSYSPWGCKRLRHDLATKKQHTIMFEVNGDPQIITIQIILEMHNPIGTKFS